MMLDEVGALVAWCRRGGAVAAGRPEDAVVLNPLGKVETAREDADS